MIRKNNIAIVHDFLSQYGGAEYVVSVFHEMFPEAPIYTSIYFPDKTWPAFKTAKVITSFMQKTPYISKIQKWLFFVYPIVFRTMDLSSYDLILSSSANFASGVKVKKGQKHICYMHNPPRFLYREEEYLKKEKVAGLLRLLVSFISVPLRFFDKRSTVKIDFIIANSKNVAKRIYSTYAKESIMVYPPVEEDRFCLSEKSEGFYLVVSRLIGYKRVDLAVEAFNNLNKRLIVIGDGPEKQRLKEMARNNVEIMGWQPDEVVADYLGRCEAFIFPGEEDFGIVSVEAQLCGKPVVAYRGGGALETVVENETGIFFDEFDSKLLADAVLALENTKWNKKKIRENALRFSKKRFKEEINKIIAGEQTDVKK